MLNDKTIMKYRQNTNIYTTDIIVNLLTQLANTQVQNYYTKQYKVPMEGNMQSVSNRTVSQIDADDNFAPTMSDTIDIITGTTCLNVLNDPTTSTQVRIADTDLNCAVEGCDGSSIVKTYKDKYVDAIEIRLVDTKAKKTARGLNLRYNKRSKGNCFAQQTSMFKT